MLPSLPPLSRTLARSGLLAACLALSACSSLGPVKGMFSRAMPAPADDMAPSPEALTAEAKLWVWGLTESGLGLVRFNAARPQAIVAQRGIQGLKPQDRLVGIDYRVARGQLYGLGRSGQLYTLEPDTGLATPVGQGIGWPMLGRAIGIDFNPAADRLRVVTEAGQNLRVHPDTGALVDYDPQSPGVQPDGVLAYAPGDVSAAHAPRLVAAGYTYNKTNEKLTTNYAIDLDRAQLVMQGSHETRQPPVSPNTGRLMTVGGLAVAGIQAADLDISDVGNVPLAVLRTDLTRLYRIDLSTGRASVIGRVGNGEALRAIAIEP